MRGLRGWRVARQQHAPWSCREADCGRVNCAGTGSRCLVDGVLRDRSCPGTSPGAARIRRFPCRSATPPSPGPP